MAHSAEEVKALVAVKTVAVEAVVVEVVAVEGVAVEEKSAIHFVTNLLVILKVPLAKEGHFQKRNIFSAC